jgi:hypothetical protein
MTMSQSMIINMNMKTQETRTQIWRPAVYTDINKDIDTDTGMDTDMDSDVDT